MNYTPLLQGCALEGENNAGGVSLKAPTQSLNPSPETIHSIPHYSLFFAFETGRCASLEAQDCGGGRPIGLQERRFVGGVSRPSTVLWRQKCLVSSRAVQRSWSGIGCLSIRCGRLGSEKEGKGGGETGTGTATAQVMSRATAGRCGSGLCWPSAPLARLFSRGPLVSTPFSNPRYAPALGQPPGSLSAFCQLLNRKVFVLLVSLILNPRLASNRPAAYGHSLTLNDLCPRIPLVHFFSSSRERDSSRVLDPTYIATAIGFSQVFRNAPRTSQSPNLHGRIVPSSRPLSFHHPTSVSPPTLAHPSAHHRPRVLFMTTQRCAFSRTADVSRPFRTIASASARGTPVSPPRSLVIFR
jgi:hypothetical protein